MKAICLACGEGKWGALTQCRRCGHSPEDHESEARHVLCSAEHLDEEGLAQVSRSVRKGLALELDEEAVAVLTEELAAMPTVPLWYVSVVMGVPFITLVLLMLLLVWLFA